MIISGWSWHGQVVSSQDATQLEQKPAPGRTPEEHHRERRMRCFPRQMQTVLAANKGPRDGPTRGVRDWRRESGCCQGTAGTTGAGTVSGGRSHPYPTILLLISSFFFVATRDYLKRPLGKGRDCRQHSKGGVAMRPYRQLGYSRRPSRKAGSAQTSWRISGWVESAVAQVMRRAGKFNTKRLATATLTDHPEG